MAECPCCSHTLLHHVRGSTSYWFCRHCWQEMPLFSVNQSISGSDLVVEKFAENQKISTQAPITLPLTQQSSRKEWIGVEKLSELLHTTSSNL